eukprot:768569-Hanusia_phi.AAC.1
MVYCMLTSCACSGRLQIVRARPPQLNGMAVRRRRLRTILSSTGFVLVLFRSYRARLGRDCPAWPQVLLVFSVAPDREMAQSLAQRGGSGAAQCGHCSETAWLAKNLIADKDVEQQVMTVALAIGQLELDKKDLELDKKANQVEKYKADLSNVTQRLLIEKFFTHVAREVVKHGQEASGLGLSAADVKGIKERSVSCSRINSLILENDKLREKA